MRFASDQSTNARRLLCGLIVGLLVGALAPSALARRHRAAWDRTLGASLTRHATRREAKRFTPGALRPVPVATAALARDIEALRARGARVTRIGQGELGDPVYRVDIGATGVKRGQRTTRAVVSAGMHGDEPAGPVAALKLMSFALAHPEFRQKFDLSVFVVVDSHGQRRTPSGKNRNRCFVAGKESLETAAIMRSLQPDLPNVDVFVDLHQAQSFSGFMNIATERGRKLDRRIVSALPAGLLADASPKHPCLGNDTYPMAAPGLCAPTPSQPGNPGTFKGWMAANGVRHSYTLEAPTDLRPDQQVRGTLKLLRSTLYHVAAEPRRAPRAPLSRAHLP